MPRLMHPLHGWHVASASDDIIAMRRNGWVDDDGVALAAKLGAPISRPAKPASAEGDNHLDLIKAAILPVKRGPGRPKKA